MAPLDARRTPVEIVDAQVHIWNDVLPENENFSRPYRLIKPGTASSPEPFSPEDLLLEMDAAGVDRAVLVASNWGTDDLGFALGAATRYPERFGVMRKLQLDRIDRRKELAAWMEPPGMLGFRILLHKDPHKSLLADGAFDWLWAGAQEQQTPVMLQGHGSLGIIAKVAKRHPALRLILDHFALAPETGTGHPREDLITPSVDELILLAEYPNVAVKASCLPNYVSDDYPFRRIHRHIERVVEYFGPERVFWGSDLSRLRCTYLQLVTMFLEELPFLSPSDLEWVMGRGLATWLSWPRQPMPK